MIEQELGDWRRLGVLGHTQAARPWIPYHERAAPALADLAGAMEGEVVAMNSLTVNLHLMMVSFFRPDATRNSVLIESSAFPSDRYAVVSQLEFHGLKPCAKFDRNCAAARRAYFANRGCDRAHRTGRQPLGLGAPARRAISHRATAGHASPDRARRGVSAPTSASISRTRSAIRPCDCMIGIADFAVWCSYKYLNAGPGAVGGCFVHERHARNFQLPRFAGWWGHNKAERFLYDPTIRSDRRRARLANQQSAHSVHGAAAGLVGDFSARRHARLAHQVHRADGFHAEAHRGALARSWSKSLLPARRSSAAVN